MEPSPLVQLAETLIGFGLLGLITAALNVVALRVVRVEEVPGCARARIRWWSAHNAAFFAISAVVTAAGLATMAATTW